MSLATIGYRQVQKIVSKWTQKYRYHISLLETKQDQIRFMVQFSLTKPQKPIPIGTVRVYFSCKNINDELQITFRFQKDSLIHSIDQSIREKQFQKWIDDALKKKLLVRQTVFYLGTSYQHTRVKDIRQDKILQQKIIIQQPQYIYISPELLQDQLRSIQVMQQPKDNSNNIKKKIQIYWKQIDKQNIKVITKQQLKFLLKNMGINLNLEQFKQVMIKVDKQDTGIIEYSNFYQIGYDIIQSLQAKKIAEDRLHQKRQEEMFGSILNFINDQVQSIENKLIQRFRSKDQDQTGITNIQQVKIALEQLNTQVKQAEHEDILTAIQIAEITKILTDLYGYKEIPYHNIHKLIIDLKIQNFSKGRVNSNLNNLQIYLREIFDQYDQKKFGKISLQNMVQAFKKSDKLKITKAQIYVLENIIPKDSKNQINYMQLSRFLSEIIKKFYICSKKRKN